MHANDDWPADDPYAINSIGHAIANDPFGTFNHLGPEYDHLVHSRGGMSSTDALIQRFSLRQTGRRKITHIFKPDPEPECLFFCRTTEKPTKKELAALKKTISEG